MFGGDSSLMGRTTIWAALMISAMEHLSLGYGYQAFWVVVRVRALMLSRGCIR